MCDPSKIHVFLGAPPPSSGPAVVSAADAENEVRDSADWRHLELTWQDGHLKPATGEAFRDSAGLTVKTSLCGEFPVQCVFDKLLILLISRVLSCSQLAVFVLYPSVIRHPL